MDLSGGLFGNTARASRCTREKKQSKEGMQQIPEWGSLVRHGDTSLSV
jgi:hypothetical protein